MIEAANQLPYKLVIIGGGPLMDELKSVAHTNICLLYTSSFVIGIVLARLLTPYDYGVVGLTAIFIAVSNVFIEAGFANEMCIRDRYTVYQ